MDPKTHRFGLFPRSLAATNEITKLFSLPSGTKMVHFPEFASESLCIQLTRYCTFSAVGSPIRKSPDQRLFAAPRGLSQLTTSFIAFRRQGIHRMLLVA